MPILNQDQASSITYTIRALRPAWNYDALMSVITGLSAQGRPVEAIVLAAFRAAQDVKAQAPTSIVWEQYWTTNAAGRPTETGTRICIECTRRFAVETMTKRGKFFYCGGCLPVERPPSDSAFVSAEFNQGTFMERTSGE